MQDQHSLVEEVGGEGRCAKSSTVSTLQRITNSHDIAFFFYTVFASHFLFIFRY